MLSYEEFKNTFCARFPEVMGPGFEDYELRLLPVVKRGKALDGFTFCLKFDVACPTAMPTYYFNDIYENYLEDPDITRHLYEVASSMKNAMLKGESLASSIDLSNIRKNVIGELVNPEVASSYILGVPHREFLNLYIIYRWAVSIDDTGIYSVVIDNDLMEHVGLSEDELYESAMRNTKRLIAPQIKSFTSVVRNMMRRSGAKDKEIRNTLKRVENDNRLWVLTNKHNFRASTAIIYKDVLRKIAEKSGGDFYILPSSVNDAIAFPVTSGVTPDHLLDMLDDSNHTFFSEDDQMLSDTIYYYDSGKEELYVCDREEVRI